MPRKLPSLNAVKAFEAVVRTGTTVGAAAELGVTHGAVSRQIRQLEAWLGRSLFAREGGRMAPTQIGLDYAARIGRALDLIHEGTHDIVDPGDQIVRVSTTASFASEWLLHRLPAFHAIHPEIQIWIEENKALTAPRSGACDLSIRMGSGGWADVKAEALMDEVLFPVCALGLARRLRCPQDLAAETLLHDADPQAQWSLWLDEIHPGGRARTEGPRFSSSSLLLKAAAAGQGVALARGHLARTWLDAGTLVRPFPQVVRLPTSYWLITRGDTEPRRPLRAFLAWLRRQAAEAP